MKILLMRHGEAVDEAPGMGDGERWLTAKGRRVTRDAAKLLVRHCAPRAVWTSPLVRAVQTAEILVEAAGLEGEVTVLREIATGSPQSVEARLRAYDGDAPLAVVGHEPTLSALVRRLLDDDAWPGFDKSGAVAMKWDREGPARFEWALLPKKLRVVDDLGKLSG